MGKKTQYEETRVQVSISYDLRKDKFDDKLLDLVSDTTNYKATLQQGYGCGCIPVGFIIFEGTLLPTVKDKQEMINAVNEAKKKL